MTGEEIVTRACDACEMLDCRKFSGAAAVEILKEALAEEGLRTSARDVFIKGLPIEWDLLMIKPSATPSFNGLLYDTAQVEIAFEIKLSGIIGGALDKTRQKFMLAEKAGVRCCYVAFCDRRSAAATGEVLGFPAFNLTWSLGGGRREDSGDWCKLSAFLQGERETEDGQTAN